MSGYCPHKCAAYPCRNKALCELNENYEPICNCGDLYEGAFCEVKKEQEQGLTTGETVGVGLAGFAVAALLLSCCVYIVFFRRNKGVKYTYYEDEGSQDNLTDPTSIANYYIDRPIISATPIPVFNSHEGFDA
ncbi:uncharacterized protein [Littorina saxatilis]|uniref:uncharacterized protein n=1 Tax=Littorina saxatilis TaxID=31220 RepID=UPI0038B6AD25